MLQSTVHVIERAETPRGELQLQRRGEHYEIISNGTFLMATHNGSSERLLVSAVLEDVPHAKRVVIGGLGVGFSLAEALRVPSAQEVKVIEIEQKIIEWNREHLSSFSMNAFQDRRTNIVHADLLEWIWQDDGRYDAICLDIDNGPEWTVTASNDKLYQSNSLIRLAHMLTSDGALAFWSAAYSAAFQALLENVFCDVRVQTVPQEKGEDDCVYIASRPKENM